MSRVWLSVGLLLSFWTGAACAETVDLLVVGGSEAACAAAVQAARLGIGNVALVSDVEMLGGQFTAEGVGPVDERIKLDGHSVNFPRSGLALEVIRAIRAYNLKTYGRETPGNCWSGTDTIEPAAAARIFEDLLAPEVKAGRLRVWRGYEPVRVLKEGAKIAGVVFVDAQGRERTFKATLTIDASDWGDVIKLGNVAHFSGVDPASRFGEKDEPRTVGPDERQEMNPITYTITLRESDRDCAIPRPEGYDARNYTSGPLKDYGILPEPYPKQFPAHAYNQRRLVDRKNYGLRPGTEAIQLNTMIMDYPLVDLPPAVRAELDGTEPGASLKNLVEMTPAQRRIVFADAKRRALGFLHFLQNDCPATTNLMRHMALVDDFGTSDKLPPKPYVREGLRLDALTVVTANDVRAADEESVTWAPTRPADAAFGFQFHIDFHPTRREWIGTDRIAWRPKHSPTRSWDQFTHRSFVPLKAFVPKTAEGLLGAGKNIGMSSVVEAALRLHPQMLLSGQASGTLAARALIEGRSPRELVNDRFAVRRIRRVLASGTVGRPGVAIYAWQDLTPDDPCFEAANVLPAMGEWELPKTFFFRPDESVVGPDGKPVTRRELAIARLRALDAADVTGFIEAEAVDPVSARWTFGNHEPLAMYRRVGRRTTGGVDGNACWVKDWQDWYDSRACTSLMKELGLNWLHSRFFKGLGWETEKTDFPAVKTFVANCHADGVKALAYVQFATLYSETFPKEVPDYEDWLMRDPDGKPRTYGDSYFRHLPCPTNRAWEDYLKRMCTIALTEGGFDGIMFDNVFAHPCYCARCQRDFARHLQAVPDPVRRFGLADVSHMRIPGMRNLEHPGEVRDPLVREWLRWRAQVTDGVIGRLVAHIRSVKPDAVVTGNTHPFRTPSILSLCGTDLYSLARHFDILFQQNENGPAFRADGSMTSRIRELKLAAAFGKVPLLLCDKDAGAEAFDERRYLLPLWEDLIFGGIPTDRTVMCPQTDPPAFVNRDRLAARKPALARFNAFAAQHRVLLKSPSWMPVRLFASPMALLTSETCHRNLAAAEEILIRNRVPFGYALSTEERPFDVPADTEVLVVAGQLLLSEAEIGALAAWAKRGGRLVVTGDCGRCDEWNAQRFENPLRAALRDCPHVVWRTKADALDGTVARTSRVNRPADRGAALMSALDEVGWTNPFAFGTLPDSVVAEYKRTPEGRVALLLDYADGSSVRLVREAEATYPGYRATMARLAAADRAADAAWRTAAANGSMDARRRDLSCRLSDALGTLPARTPLNARITGTVVRDGYRIEKLLAESRPGFHVTAHVYVPEDPRFRAPYPAVLVPCGHADTGKNHPSYQYAGVLAARSGFVALVFDPAGQGERAERTNCLLGVTHNAYSALANLLGETFLQIRLWDGMRMLDYLAARPDVDAKRLCAMGNSGGGTMTAMLAAVDPRLRATAPASYISSLRHVVEGAGAQDGEQLIFGQLKWGLNQGGLLLLRETPKLVCANRQDFFPWTGTCETAEVVREVLRKTGQDGFFALHEEPGRHGWKARAMDESIRWLRRQLGLAELSLPSTPTRPDGTPEVSATFVSVPDNLVTATGNVRDLPCERSVYQLLRDRLAELDRERPHLDLAAKRAKAVELA